MQQKVEKIVNPVKKHVNIGQIRAVEPKHASWPGKYVTLTICSIIFEKDVNASEEMSMVCFYYKNVYM